MEESQYPAIDIETMNQFVIETGKLDKNGFEITEDTVTYYLAGPQVKHKRTMKIRMEKPRSVHLYTSYGNCHKIKVRT